MEIKYAIHKSGLTFKQLIDKFYELNTDHLVKDYELSLRLQFESACLTARKPSTDAKTGEKCISIDDFIKFMFSKKIKVQRDLIVDICFGDSDIEAIRYISFVKLHMVASCMGDKTKLGAPNFIKLMKHMNMPAT